MKETHQRLLDRVVDKAKMQAEARVSALFGPIEEAVDDLCAHVARGEVPFVGGGVVNVDLSDMLRAAKKILMERAAMKVADGIMDRLAKHMVECNAAQKCLDSEEQ